MHEIFPRSLPQKVAHILECLRVMFPKKKAFRMKAIGKLFLPFSFYQFPHSKTFDFLAWQSFCRWINTGPRWIRLRFSETHHVELFIITPLQEQNCVSPRLFKLFYQACHVKYQGCHFTNMSLTDNDISKQALSSLLAFHPLFTH